MGDYLLLQNPKACPSCGFTGQFRRSGFCGSCGTRLFPHLEYDFKTFAKEVSQNFWAYCPVRGWLHRDHLIRECAKPTQRNIESKPIPAGYGTHTTPAEVASRGGRITKRRRQEMLRHVMD